MILTRRFATTPAVCRIQAPLAGLAPSRARTPTSANRVRGSPLLGRLRQI